MENRSAYTNILVKGILGSVIFIYVGYLVSGIIGKCNDSLNLSEACISVLKSPFDSYFNDYSPITMILAFIFFEIFFFFKLTRRGKLRELSAPEQFAPDIIEAANNSGIDVVNSRINEMFADYKSNENVDSDNAYADMSTSGESNDVDLSNIEEEMQNQFFDQDITTELLNDDYSIAQIKAMQAILKYVDIKSAKALEKLFKVTMSATDISEYIKIIYE